MINNGLIGQEVGTAVLLVSHLVCYAKGGKIRKLLHGFLKGRFKVRVFAPVFPTNLLNNTFWLEMYLYLASAKLSAFFKSEKQDPVFSLVVNALPRILPGPHKLISLFIQNALARIPLGSSVWKTLQCLFCKFTFSGLFFALPQCRPRGRRGCLLFWRGKDANGLHPGLLNLPRRKVLKIIAQKLIRQFFAKNVKNLGSLI